MKLDERRIEEYKTLRNEIIGNVSHARHVYLLGLTTMLVVLGWIVAKTEYLPARFSSDPLHVAILVILLELFGLIIVYIVISYYVGIIRVQRFLGGYLAVFYDRDDSVIIDKSIEQPSPSNFGWHYWNRFYQIAKEKEALCHTETFRPYFIALFIWTSVIYTLYWHKLWPNLSNSYPCCDCFFGVLSMLIGIFGIVIMYWWLHKKFDDIKSKKKLFTEDWLSIIKKFNDSGERERIEKEIFGASGIINRTIT